LAEQALPYATSLALAFGAAATLLRVVTQPSAVEFVHHPQAMEFVHSLRDQDQAEATSYLTGPTAEMLRAGVETRALVVSDSSPAQAIVDRADGDLIVMCTHGRGVLGRAVFGSVADKVLRAGRHPLLLIPANGLVAAQR
jgi:nucleotide-binding universal stress UspA family protein